MTLNLFLKRTKFFKIMRKKILLKFKDQIDVKKSYDSYIKICKLIGVKTPVSFEKYCDISFHQFCKGLQKYGTSLRNANLGKDELLNHLTEEIIDLNAYNSELQKL
jgi:Cdc6-like AAA superfamily ATPase